MFQNILCALDGSEHSRRAAATACSLAQKFGSQVTFLTVAKELKVTEEVRRFMTLEHISGEPQYVLDEMTEQILREAKSNADDCGVKGALAEVQTGNPARTIVAVADRKKCDAIILGSRGLGDLEGVFLGSVSHKVATMATCTVITVR